MRPLALALLVLSFVSCGGSSPTTPSAADVAYEVTGSATRVSLTYASAGGGTSQRSSEPLPWTYSMSGKKGDFLYISAQIIEGTGSVTVRILRNGTLYKSTTSSGFASIATASGTIE